MKNLQVNLLFNADTTQAQQNIQQLSNLLHQISNAKTGFSGGALSQAAKDAQALAGHLANAVNANTGKLDLSRLNSSLSSAKTNLNTLTSSLQAAGPIGQQAFLKIATAISQAEAPTIRMSASMRNLLTTLGNTAKWQVASSAIHGLTGAISESISYIEKFDRALTDIKMVSDLNNDQLLKYAENTRKIAKAVNATALEVAQGSTLYFQQGLSDAETEKRILVTQKLANVTGETAEKVTSEMTAIWNNFAEGSENLESYADKLAYLGAKTAASNSQISNAMQKFAASAKVVGLSYDYAAAAVAQVIDRTQMAPEEVGTAFKTILSRIQGLKLGETLEDGVDLNKYGEALDIVGVKILDANDQLRDADDILGDLGAKWDTLDSAQKKALATTVAGLRQQTQFMALMEEWDDIEAQVSDLSNATGYLTKQNEDYANSVAGIKKRYEETKNALFDAILDESTLKGFYSSMEGVLKTVTKIVDTMGGMGPILLTIAGLFSKQLIPMMTSGISNFVANIQTAFGITESKVKQIQTDFARQLQVKIDSGQLDSYQAKQAEVAQMLIREKQRLLEISKSASSIEKEQINNQIALLEMQGANVQKAYEEAAVLDRQLKTMSNQVIEATKKQNALNATTSNFKNTTKDWTTEDADKIADMTNMDAAAMAARKKALQSQIAAGTDELGTAEATKGALEQELAMDQARLAARQRQQESIELLRATPDATKADRNALSNDLKKQLPPQLSSESGTYSYTVDDKGTVEQDILNLKEKIAQKEQEINQLESDEGPLGIKKAEMAAAEEELKMLQEAENLKRKANSAAIMTTKDTKVAGAEYGLLSTEATGDSEEGTEIARQAIASIGQKRGEAEGAESLKLTTDEITGDRVVNTDTESSIANFEALKQKQGELIEQSEQYKRGVQDINGVMAQLKTAETEVANATEKHGAGTKTAKRAQADYAKQLQQTRNSAKAFGKDLESSLKKIKGDKAAAEIAEINTALEKIEATDDVKEIEQAFQSIIRITDQLGTEFQQAAGIVGGAAEQMANNIAGNSDEAKAKLEMLGDTAMQEGQQTAQAGQQFSQFSQTIKDGENAPVSFASKLQGTVTSMASFASSCQMALSGMQVFMSAFEEGASPMQRFTAIMSGLSMLLPVVATAIGLIDAAQKKQTASTIAATIAKWAENAAWYASPVMWIPLIIMAAIAAIALLIGWIVNMTNALSASEQAHENAKQELETATAVYEKATQAAQEFKEAVTGYEDAVEGIKGLTEGTLEYAEAVRKANEQAVALIEMNEGLAGKYHVNEQGLITFEPGALEEAQKALMNEQYDAAFMKAKAEKKVIDTGAQVQRENIQERAEYSDYVQTGTYSDGSKKTAYKDIGTEFFNDFEKHLESKSNDGERQAARTTEEIKNFIVANAASKGLTLDETQINTLTDKLQESSGSLDKLKTTTDAQIEAVKANTKALLKEQYGDAVDKYGEAAVYGAKEILGDKMAKDFNGTGKTATDYFKENHAGGTTNNLKNLRDEDSAVGTILQEAFELSDEDMAKGEIKISDDGFVTITSTTDDDDVIKRISTEEFDKIMAGGSVSEADILAYLGGGDANIQAAEAEAVNDGILDYHDTRIRGKEYGSYEGLTAGTYEDIYNKGAKLTGEDSDVFQQKVQKHLAQFSGQEKEAIAKAINNLDTADIIKGNLDELLQDDYSKIFADSLGMTKEAFDQYTEEIIKNNKALEGNKAAAAKAAKGAIESERKFKKLGEVYADLKDNLDESKRGTEAFSTACVDMADGLNAAFGEDTFDAKFVADNLDMVKKAMEGDIAAMQQLQDKAGEEILIDITPATKASELSDVAKEINDWIGSQSFNDLKIGASLDSTGMTDSFNEMLLNGEATVEEMNKLLKGIGFEPEIGYKDMKIDDAIKSWGKNQQSMEIFDPITQETKTVTLENLQELQDSGTATIQVPYIKGKETVKVNTPKTMGNSAKNGSTGGGGGSGSKPKVVQKKAPVKGKKAKDEIERYHEISKVIEDQERILDRLSKAKDRAYGANKLKAIDKEIAALKKMNELDNQHLEQIREKLAVDKQLAQIYGVTFDEFGRINNYEEVIKNRMDQWKTEQEAFQAEETAYEEAKNKDENYDADGAIKLDIELRKEASNESYENFKDSLSQYEDTMKLLEDTTDKIKEQWDQIADKAVEKITYEIEFKMEYSDFTLNLLDFQISKLGEDFDVFAEITSISASKIDTLNDKMGTLSDGIGEYWAQYEAGIIDLDHFVEGMNEILPDILSVMEQLLALDAEMMAYYGNAFDAAEQEFSSYLDLIDHGISKLDHFKNMLSILRKENDNELVDTVLQAQYLSASHRLQASTDWYKTTKHEYDELYGRWQREKDTLDPKELEMLEEKLKVARTKMKEADEQRLSDLEEVGAKAQEILQNNLDSARKKLEKSLVGSTLEDYMTELDRLSKKQEEYLTNTNKMYETNKLIRQAQMDMDKTENNRAKQQYNDYIKYIGQLQESGKLSEYELSIAQAKYELLQAQIALEEAQDAKNQVRLTRDAEGNYGYVYTANEDKVAEAEQAVADAENALYNIGLEGAQNYQSKKAEILQEAIDTFASLEEQYQTGQIATEEEFNRKMTEAKQYYYERLKEYDGLYFMALDTMQEESYDNTVDYELNSTDVFDTFATSVENYIGDVNQAFGDYNNQVSDVEQEVGSNLQELEQKTSEVTQETFLLVEQTEELTNTIDTELLSVREITSAWGAYRDEIYENIQANETLIGQLREIQELQMGETEDYSLFIKNLVSQGKDYDSRLVQEALAKRWEKMGGTDNYNYQQMINDYVNQYASENNISTEEAEAALQNDAWYKTLKMLRQYKIERTDWSAKEAEIKAANPDADTSWVTDVRNQKLAEDWSSKIRQYVTWNKGIRLDDDYLQEMLHVRQAKIDSMEDSSGVQSNEDLIKELSKDGWLIDTRYTPQQTATEPSAGTDPNTPVSGPLSEEAIDAYATEVLSGKYGNGADRIANLKRAGLSEDDIEKVQAAVNDKAPSAPKTPSTPTTPKTPSTPTTPKTEDKDEDKESNKTVVDPPKPKDPPKDQDPPWEKGDKVKTKEQGWCVVTAYNSKGEYASYYIGGTSFTVQEGPKNINGQNYYKNKDGYWFKGLQLQSAETGGYTGAWGPEGRLAVLHEKEIVLNKQDTENFLTATNILREINGVLDRNALIQSLGALDLRAMTINSPADSVLQQEVTIHADFPNVTDHNEIEIAIDNLINAASQHAYKI